MDVIKREEVLVVGGKRTVAKIRRNRMTFRRFGSLQSWHELCPPFLSTSRCDRNTIESSKLFVSCEPLRIIIEEKPNSETRIDVCTYLLITSTLFLCFFFNHLCKCIAQLHFVIRLKELIYIYWIIEYLFIFVSYFKLCYNAWRYWSMDSEVMNDWITTLFKQYEFFVKCNYIETKNIG